MKQRTFDILLSAWRENRLAAVHIDMQDCFLPAIELSRSVGDLSARLREQNVDNIWVAYDISDYAQYNCITTVRSLTSSWEGLWPILPQAGADHGDTAVTKKHDSAFYWPDSELHTYLRNANKDTILVTGVLHDCCVGKTIADGILSNRYNIIAVGDCINIPAHTETGYNNYARWMATECGNRERTMRVYDVPRSNITEQYQNRFHIATADQIVNVLTSQESLTL